MLSQVALIHRPVIAGFAQRKPLNAIPGREFPYPRNVQGTGTEGSVFFPEGMRSLSVAGNYRSGAQPLRAEDYDNGRNVSFNSPIRDKEISPISPIRSQQIHQQPSQPVRTQGRNIQPQNSEPLRPTRQYTGPETRTQSLIPPEVITKPKPITQVDFEAIKQRAKNGKNDPAIQLFKVAKKLVEASVVLADEGGRADQKTMRKNQEKWALQAHKIVKKLATQVN